MTILSTGRIAAGLAAVALAAWQWLGSAVPPAAPPGAGAVAIVPPARGEEPRPPAAAQVASRDGAGRSVAAIEQSLFVTGSLRGTDRPAWGTARGEPLRPNRALRDRFDHYLLAMGEATVGELTAVLAAHAERDLGAATAADVLAVWQRYLALQRHAFQQVANPADPASMQAALQEHRQVRQSVLGLHWAQAFYGDDEAMLEATLSAPPGRNAQEGDVERRLLSPPPGTDPAALHRQRVAHFGVGVADRLQAVDAEDAAWDLRLGRARADVEALRGDPSRSEPQRDAALARYLQEAYPDATERLRASAQLGL